MAEVKAKHDKHAALLAAGRAILAEKGFEATTVAEIVAHAGVAQGTYYLYFSSKAALVAAINAEMNEHILEAVREATSHAQTAAEVVTTGVAAAFQQLEGYRDVLRIVRSRAILHRAETSREHWLGTYHNLITELIRHRQQTGEVDPSVNPTISAQLIAGLIDLAADECFLYDPQAPQDIYMAEVVRFVQQALGIRQPG